MGANAAGTADEICAYNVIWAKMTGIVSEPLDYENFTGMNVNSTDADFQCALYDKATGVDGDAHGVIGGHNCTKPCTSTFTQCAVTPVTTTAAPSDSSMTWWMVLLMVLLLAAIIAAAYYFLVVMKQEKPKKKKRALAPPKEEPPAPAPVPVVYTVTHQPVMAHPMYHPQQITYAAPAAPIYHAAPLQQQGSFVAAPPQYQAHPVMTSSVAAPVATYM